MRETNWTWGQHAPDAWYVDRSNGSVLIRGYLAIFSRTPDRDSPTELDVWSGNFEGRDLHIMFMDGRPEIPSPITYAFAGGDNIAVRQSDQLVKLRPGRYVLLSVPVQAHYRAVTDAMEREASARLDSAAGIVAAVISPNAIYQRGFQFLAEASGSGVFVATPPFRTPRDGRAQLNPAAMVAIRDVLRAIGTAHERIRARALASLRWYSQAYAETNRLDAFVKFWVALEAIAFSRSGSPVPLINLCANSYGREVSWVRDTFSINQLAQLRNDIVHAGERPMLHGNLIRFLEALYVDALRAQLGLSNERRTELALPEGRPLSVPRWRNSGSVATGILPGGSPR
jgi:Apea-like HEPN